MAYNSEALADDLVKDGKIKKEDRNVFKLVFDGVYVTGAEEERNKILIQVNRLNPRIESLLETVKEFTEEKDEEMKNLIETEFKELCYMVKAQQDRLNRWIKPKERR